MAVGSRYDRLRRDVASVRGLLANPGGHVHLAGIAGVGMAGIALHLAGRGFRVSGCDLVRNRIAEWLIAHGAPIEEGHDPRHISAEVSWVVRSAAVSDDNLELLAARAAGIPVFVRGVVLPALIDGRTSVAVSGTHGKTTTSAMIAQILASAGMQPGFCIGGEIPPLGGVAATGSGACMVVEADESDGTVALYDSDIAVVTNIEHDHMEHFRDQTEMTECFRAFAGQARRRVIFCADDARASELCGSFANSVSYGFAETAAVRGCAFREDERGLEMKVVFQGLEMGVLKVPMPGKHNACNALGACAAALELGVPFDRIAAGLAGFVSARRRFEKVLDSPRLTVISDYAHHPTEIRSLIQAARLLPRRRIVGVFQPHRYSRTLALGRDFPPAFQGLDELILTPVYAASEEPIEGGRSEDLLRHIRDHGGGLRVKYAESLDAAWQHLRETARVGDLLLVIGAGDVEELAFRAREELLKEE